MWCLPEQIVLGKQGLNMVQYFPTEYSVYKIIFKNRKMNIQKKNKNNITYITTAKILNIPLNNNTVLSSVHVRQVVPRRGLRSQVKFMKF